jgi:hypothetical protein
MYSTIEDLCSPAFFFLIIVFFDIVFIVFGKNKNKTKPLNSKIKSFIILCLCGIGWSFIINSTCVYDQNIAWGFAAIPLLYLSFKLYS